LKFCNLGLEYLTVRFKEFAAQLDAHLAGPCVCCVLLHRPNRHSRGAQPVKESNPLDVGGRVTPVSILGALYRVEEANPLVVAKGVYAKTRASSHLLYRKRLVIHSASIELRARSKSSTNFTIGEIYADRLVRL
jgi:hypothetical protein